MVIAAAVCIASILIIVWPQNKGFWAWSAIILCGYSCLYFYFTPTIYDDLYRHYTTYQILTSDYFGLNEMLQGYSTSNPVYILYLNILSKFNKQELLPVVTGCICFFSIILCLKNVFDIEKCKALWAKKICVILLLLLIRYLDISGIRNILASTLLCYALYRDLVLHDKKVYILYIVTPLIHTAAIIYAFLRVALIFYTKYTKFILKIIFVFSTLIILNAKQILSRIFSNSAFIFTILNKLTLYYEGEVSLGVNLTYLIVYLAMYICDILLILYFEMKIDAEKKYNNLYQYIVVMFFFTAGCIAQRELFNRARMIFIPLSLIFFAALLSKRANRNVFDVAFDGKSVLAGKISYALFIIFAVAYFIFTIKATYISYDPCFGFT